jgi:hypothetical protein
VAQALKALRWVFLAGVLAFLIHKLSEVGWAEVAQSLPTNPLFYLIFGLIYCILPASEVVVYRWLWRRPMARSFPVFVRKRVFNDAVLGYSGEAYLAFWARTHLAHDPDKRADGLPLRYLLQTIKDNAVLSAVGGWLVTAGLIIVFLAMGKLSLITNADPHIGHYLIGGAALIAVLAPLALKFRHIILHIPTKLAAAVLAVHTVRVLLVLGLQATQWSIALPQVAVSTWLTFLTAQMILQRLPFLPNKDLLFVGLALSMAGVIAAPQAAVAGMFIAAGALSLSVNLALFALTSFGAHAPRRADWQAPQADG